MNLDLIYIFDDQERLISSEKKVNGSTVLRTRQLYNINDQLTHENWKMGTKTYYRVLTYNTSTDYSLATVSMPTNQTLSMGYDSLRRLTSVTGGLYNQTYTYRDRDATYTTTQVSRLGYTRSGATTLNFDYTYDTLGNIETYKAPSKTTITYTYDNQGQLTKAVGAKTYTYTYDSVGNILSASDGTTTHNYTYGDSDWHDKLTKFDGQSISYDNAGNPTSYYNGTRWSFTWVNGRSLTAASGGGKTLSFTYDLQDGTRSTKTVGTEVHNYIYAGGKLLRETYGNTTLDFIYDVNGRPYAMIVNESTTYYYITNLQGDVINVVNSSGTTVASYEYDPYGNPVVEDETALGFTNPLRYRGYYYDAETEMYYLQSRYYDPVVGRFISPDILVSTGQGMLGNNMFAYCNNNPIIHYDQTGTALDTVLDIVSLGTSLADVVINPASPVAWFSLAADVACLVLPGVTGGGGLVRFVAGAEKLADAANFVDDVVDASKAISTTKEAGKAIHDTYMTLDKTKDIFTNKALGTIFEEVTSKLRPDAVDTLNCIVYELKPYNTNSFSRAIKQVQKYLDIIPDDLKNWTVVIDMYY